MCPKNAPLIIFLQALQAQYCIGIHLLENSINYFPSFQVLTAFFISSFRKVVKHTEQQP
jgi:hypothetical protein